MDFHLLRGVHLVASFKTSGHVKGPAMLRLKNLLAVSPLLLSACTGIPASDIISPTQTAALKATCTKVMRLQEGQAQFDGCVSNLSDTAAELIEYARSLQARRACEALPLKPKTPEFARCILDREDAERVAKLPPAEDILKLNAVDIKPADNISDSYYTASFDVRRRREQMSCAVLGLEPDTDPFVTCVNNLDMDLFAISHPAS